MCGSLAPETLARTLTALDRYEDRRGVERTLLRQASQRGYGEILKALLSAEN